MTKRRLRKTAVIKLLLALAFSLMCPLLPLPPITRRSAPHISPIVLSSSSAHFILSTSTPAWASKAKRWPPSKPPPSPPPSSFSSSSSRPLPYPTSTYPLTTPRLRLCWVESEHGSTRALTRFTRACIGEWKEGTEGRAKAGRKVGWWASMSLKLPALYVYIYIYIYIYIYYQWRHGA